MAKKISGPQYYCSVMRRRCVKLGEEPEEIFTQGGTKRSVARLNKKERRVHRRSEGEQSKSGLI
jgi:hypothetical protein